MYKVKIKLLSANKAWRGRRFKTPEYEVFEKELFFTLPAYEIPIGGLELYIKAGLSSRLADIDNIAKQTIDVMQIKYNFNDNRIYKLILEKEVVKKGEEYLKFEFNKYEKNTTNAR